MGGWISPRAGLVFCALGSARSSSSGIDGLHIVGRFGLSFDDGSVVVLVRSDSFRLAMWGVVFTFSFVVRWTVDLFRCGSQWLTLMGILTGSFEL
jgi:hypothetical protein